MTHWLVQVNDMRNFGRLSRKHFWGISMNHKKAKPFTEAIKDDVLWFVQPDGAIFATALYDYVRPRSEAHNDWDLKLSFTFWDTELYYKNMIVFTPNSKHYEKYWICHLKWGIIEKYTDRCMTDLPKVYQSV